MLRAAGTGWRDLVPASFSFLARGWPARGAGWPPPQPEAWANGPECLQGDDDDLLGVLERVPTGRLVVLGEPGTGKTILLVRLVLGMLARRVPGAPVPVLVPLASWDPAAHDLNSWLEARLGLDYAELRQPAPGRRGVSLGRALLEAGMVVLVLDGLDEIPEPVRGRAIARVNDALRPGQRLVVSARLRSFEAATRPVGGVEIGLAGATGVVLCPLDASVVADYLRGSAGGPTSASRWEPVLASLVTPMPPPVAQALTTPLAVALARTIYNPRPGDQSATSLPDPAELLDTARFPTRAHVEEHLFDAFVPAAYRSSSEPAPTRAWTADQAERWLVFLAKHLDRNLNGTTDLGWWTIRYAAPRALVGIVVGLAAGLAGCVAAVLGGRLGVGLGVGFGLGIAVGLAVGLGVAARTGHRGGAAHGLAGGLTGGLSGGLVAGAAGTIGIGLAGGPTGGIGIGIGVGLAVGPPSGFAGGLVGSFVGGLVSALLVGVSNGLAAGVTNGLGVALAAGLTVGIVGRRLPARRMRWSAAGLGVGLPVGLAVGLAASVASHPGVGLAVGSTTGLAAALGAGLTGTPVEAAAATGPRAALAHDRRTFCAVGLTAFLAGAPVAWLITAVAVSLESGQSIGAAARSTGAVGIGIANGLWFALTVSFLQAASGSLLISQGWLALHGRLPLRLMAFLADAHEQRGVLRQVGTVYQFRHAELQLRLARRP